MTGPLRAVLVDDEPLARERMRALLADAAAATGVQVEVIAEAENGRRAVPLVHETRPDVVFLDVQMPGLDGFDTLDLLAHPRPHVVFVTAYDEHAVRAFEVHALDYLTKPVRAARLAATLQRLAALHDRPDPAQRAFEAERGREQEEAPLRRLALPAGRRLRVVELDEVRYFEAREKMVFARVDGRDHPVEFTLHALEKRLDAEAFCRVHRAFLVNVGAVRELVPWVGETYQVRLEGGAEVPVSRRRLSALRALLAG